MKIRGGGLNRFYGIPTSPSASIMAQNIQLFGPREGFLTHQWIITGNNKITDKYYDEAKMRTRQERVATILTYIQKILAIFKVKYLSASLHGINS